MASVDGAPILKLGDSSVYLVFFSLEITELYIFVYIYLIPCNQIAWIGFFKRTQLFFCKKYINFRWKDSDWRFFIKWSPNYKQFLQGRTKIVLMNGGLLSFIVVVIIIIKLNKHHWSNLFSLWIPRLCHNSLN